MELVEQIQLAIYLIWRVQIVLVAALILYAVYRRQWFAAAGAIVGTAIGFLPSAADVIGARQVHMMLIIVVASIVVLTASYLIAKRWVLFALVLGLFGLPFIYIYFLGKFYPHADYPIFEKLFYMAEVELFLSLILPALACRELFALIGRFYAKERAA